MVLRVLVLLLVLPFGALAEDRRVQVTQTLGKDRLELWVELTDLTEATITVSAAELTNVANALPTTVDAAGRTRFLLASWRRVDRNQPWRVRDWKYRFRYGRRLAESPPPRPWRRPFDGNFPVLQKPFGTFSHGTGSQNEEAWDWAMPQGTPVLAARDGVVVGVRADCTEGGPDQALKEDANSVLLRHDDGTFSEYLHLKPGGVAVRLGARVRAGERLGASGHTGFSSEPHLHFAVFHTLDGETRRTLPIQFEGEPAPSTRATRRKAINDAIEALEASQTE
jgi:murein DD-endopeptidase MepM/ murein hydrolase activator NlpD